MFFENKEEDYYLWRSANKPPFESWFNSYSASITVPAFPDWKN